MLVGAVVLLLVVAVVHALPLEEGVKAHWYDSRSERVRAFFNRAPRPLTRAYAARLLDDHVTYVEARGSDERSHRREQGLGAVVGALGSTWFPRGGDHVVQVHGAWESGDMVVVRTVWASQMAGVAAPFVFLLTFVGDEVTRLEVIGDFGAVQAAAASARESEL